MAKTITITGCKDCPHFIRGGAFPDGCGLVGLRFGPGEGVNYPPPWCQLPDAPEPKPLEGYAKYCAEQDAREKAKEPKMASPMTVKLRVVEIAPTAFDALLADPDARAKLRDAVGLPPLEEENRKANAGKGVVNAPVEYCGPKINGRPASDFPGVLAQRGSAIDVAEAALAKCASLEAAVLALAAGSDRAPLVHRALRDKNTRPLKSNAAFARSMKESAAGPAGNSGSPFPCVISAKACKKTGAIISVSVLPKGGQWQEFYPEAKQ